MEVTVEVKVVVIEVTVVEATVQVGELEVVGWRSWRREQQWADGTLGTSRWE